MPQPKIAATDFQPIIAAEDFAPVDDSGGVQQPEGLNPVQLQHHVNPAAVAARAPRDVIARQKARRGVPDSAPRPPGPRRYGVTGLDAAGAAVKGVAKIPLSLVPPIGDNPITQPTIDAQQSLASNVADSVAAGNTDAHAYARSIMGQIPIVGQALFGLSGPSFAAAENRPPTRDENLDAIETGAQTAGTLALASPRVQRFGGKLVQTTRRGAAATIQAGAPDLNHVLARGDAAAIKESLAKGQNPKEALLREFNELPEGPDGVKAVHERMDDINHNRIQPLLEGPEYAHVKATRGQVANAIMAPAMEEAKLQAAEMPSAPPLEEFPSVQRAAGRLKWIQEQYGTLELSPAQINDLKSKLYGTIKNFGELTDAERGVQAMRRRQAAGLRGLLDELTTPPDGSPSPVTELNRHYGGLAAAVDALEGYGLKEKAGTLPRSRGNWTARGVGATVGAKLGGPVGMAVGYKVGDSAHAAVTSPSFAFKAARTAEAIRPRGPSAPAMTAAPDLPADAGQYEASSPSSSSPIPASASGDVYYDPTLGQTMGPEPVPLAAHYKAPKGKARPPAAAARPRFAASAEGDVLPLRGTPGELQHWTEPTTEAPDVQAAAVHGALRKTGARPPLPAAESTPTAAPSRLVGTPEGDVYARGSQPSGASRLPKPPAAPEPAAPTIEVAADAGAAPATEDADTIAAAGIKRWKPGATVILKDGRVIADDPASPGQPKVWAINERNSFNRTRGPGGPEQASEATRRESRFPVRGPGPQSPATAPVSPDQTFTTAPASVAEQRTQLFAHDAAVKAATADHAAATKAADARMRSVEVTPFGRPHRNAVTVEGEKPPEYMTRPAADALRESLLAPTRDKLAAATKARDAFHASLAGGPAPATATSAASAAKPRAPGVAEPVGQAAKIPPESREYVRWTDAASRRQVGYVVRRFPSKGGPAMAVWTPTGERFVLESAAQAHNPAATGPGKATKSRKK